MTPCHRSTWRPDADRRRPRTGGPRWATLVGTALLAVTLGACGVADDPPDRPPATATTAGAATTRLPTGDEGANDGPESGLVEEARVIAVIDGDTVRVHVAGQVELVRLTGIDTPEVSGPYRDEECYGDRASRITAGLLPVGSSIGLERDVSDRDPYDRLLRAVWTSDRDGVWTLVNEAIVAAGAADARAYPPDTTYADRLERAESVARAGGAGMWSACRSGRTGDPVAVTGWPGVGTGVSGRRVAGRVAVG